MVFYDGFLFLVKELGLLTNISHWVRDFFKNQISIYHRKTLE
jgi:hypothetical protein